MNFIKKIINFFTGRISDEEFERLIEKDRAVCCPNCNTYIPEQDLIDNNWLCIRCKSKIKKS